ncbi:MAG: class I SAM-dependent methyltransferase [Anaerostipes sp.]|nr:class I SAM-dependent methyltransferase [Anaerostipes sp.]
MRISITSWVQEELRRWIDDGAICVDATVGKGGDTIYLCEAAGAKGKVVGFDIQKEALKTADKRLKEKNLKAELHLAGHECMDEYLEEDTVSVIMFNLGYLPGGNHKIATKSATTLQAIEKGLLLLKHGGILSLCIYSGGDNGFEERNQVLEFLKGLDDKKYLVIQQKFFNKVEHAPLPVFILKL